MTRHGAGCGSSAMRWLWAVLALVLLSGADAQGQPAAASPAATTGAAGAVVRAPHLSLEMVLPAGQLARGASTPAGLHFVLEPDWHVYWVNAGDAGDPPTVRWTLPAGITADPFLYPVPQRLALGPLMNFGYEREVTFPLTMHVAAAAATGPATLRADVDWLVCSPATCLPGRGAVQVTRTIVAAGTTVTVDPKAGAVLDAGLRSLPQALPAGDAAHFAADGKGYTLGVALGHKTASALFFPLDQTVIINVAAQTAQPTAKGVRLRLVRDENQAGKLAALNGVLVLPDGTGYTVAATPGTVPAAVAADSPTDAAGLGQALLLAFAGGLILNLMPCVFPVLFIKGLSLLNSSREERSRMRAHGWVYTAGILVSFWVVVGVLLGVRAVGGSAGWGFQFQSPTFLALMAMFLFFLALSLAGQFEIGLSLTSAGGGLAQKEGYTGSFFTGVLAMVVATPCTAPLMGVAVGYALAHSGVISFAVFTALGLGLAAPYLLLAYNPGWTRVLPKPGAWMEVVKQLTAIPIFATVVWLVWLFGQAAGNNALLGLLAAFILLGIAGAVLGRWPGRRGAAVAAGVVVLLGVLLPVGTVRALAGHVQGKGNDWKPFSAEAVADARSQGKPVLVDFTASWCLSCQVNERVVLDRADVQDRLRRSGVVLLKADWTRHDASIGDALATLGRSGIPTYALYPSAPEAPARLLPEVLTTGAVYEALDSLGPAKGTTAGGQ